MGHSYGVFCKYIDAYTGVLSGNKKLLERFVTLHNRDLLSPSPTSELVAAKDAEIAELKKYIDTLIQAGQQQPTAQDVEQAYLAAHGGKE
jgi:hypothetical protein